MWRSMRARRARLLLALLAVTLGVSVATALATLSLQVGDDLARTAGAPLGDSAAARLKRSFWKNNLLESAPELALACRLDGRPARVLGTWFDRPVAIDGATWRTGIARLRPMWPVAGRWPRDDGHEIALGRELARALGAAPGREIAIERGGRRARWTVSGVVSAGGFDDRNAWAPLANVQALADRPGEIDRLWLSALVLPEPRKAAPDPARDPTGYERYMCTAYPAVVAANLAQTLPGAEVLPATEVVAGEARVVGRLNLLLLLLAIAALVVERSVELGMLRAIGAGGREIATLLLGETLVVSLVGGALGWPLGSLAAAAIRGGTFGHGASFQPLLLPVALVLALIVAVVGTLGPLRLAMRLDPATVLRG